MQVTEEIWKYFVSFVIFFLRKESEITKKKSDYMFKSLRQNASMFQLEGRL